MRQNNAEVLILHRRVASNVALFRPIRHARFVAWEFRPTLVCFFATLIGLLQWILGRLKWPIVLQSTGAPRLIVFPIRHPRPHSGARRFIPHQIGVEGFLRRLQHDNIPHAVLRWFDSLPEIAPGEDLDLLVDDAQLETVRKILTIGVGIQPIDLYSVSGTLRFRFSRHAVLSAKLRETDVGRCDRASQFLPNPRTARALSEPGLPRRLSQRNCFRAGRSRLRIRRRAKSRNTIITPSWHHWPRGWDWNCPLR